MEEIQLAKSDKSALATVKAHSVGLLAVHRPITRSGGQDNRRSAGWTVTHKPTGFKACHVDGSLADAKKRARLLLACGIDWDTTDTDALSRAGRECAALREILSLRPARQAAPGASVSPKVGPVDLDAAIDYARQRADQTRTPYLVSKMGHVLPDLGVNLAAVERDLGGLHARVHPKRPK